MPTKYTVEDAPTQSKYTVEDAPQTQDAGAIRPLTDRERFSNPNLYPVGAPGEGVGENLKNLVQRGGVGVFQLFDALANPRRTAAGMLSSVLPEPVVQGVNKVVDLENKIPGMHYLTTKLPEGTDNPVHAGYQAVAPGGWQAAANVAPAAGQVIATAGLGEAVPAIAADTVRGSKSILRKGANIISGTGPKVAEDLAAKTAEANAAAQAKADAANATLANKRAQQVKQHFEKTQQVRQANEAAQALQSRKAALNRGVEQLDPKFQEDLKATEKNVRDQANEKYNTVRHAMGEHGNPQPVEYVRNGRDLDLEATEAKLPPVKEGYTRLYRSESPTTKFADVFDKSKLQDNRPEGKAYTDDLNSAAYYKQSYGRDAKTTYIDVPNSVAETSRIQPGEYVLGEPPTVPSSSLAQAVKNAEAKIQGSSENLKVFRDILSKHPEGEPESIAYQGAQIPKGHPLYDVLKEGNESAPATFSDLQGYYSELGDKLSSGNLPGDVYQAMKSLHGSIGDLMQKMADSKGVGDQLKDARSFYRDYMGAFRDHSSPLYKAMNATESGKSIAALKGADKSGIETLARYNPELARRANTIRGYQTEANSITSRPPAIKPEPVLPPKPQPSVADVKKIGLQDIREAKAAKLEGHKGPAGGTLGHVAAGAGGWHLIHSALAGNPEGMITGGALAVAPYALAKVLKSPTIVKLLSEPTPADIAAIPPELRGDLPTIVKAAQAQGIKVHPAFVVMAGATNAPQQ